MCTVTWQILEDGYEVFCNRDELKTRKPALPPCFAECNGVRYLAPVDPEGGGSWLGVNEFGLALCLVNHYPCNEGISSLPGDHEKGYRSRGLLLTGLLDCASPATVLKRLWHKALDQYRPFLLLAFELHGRFRMAEWNGLDLHVRQLKQADLPVTSSSFATNAVISLRKENFAQLAQRHVSRPHEMLVKFHHSHLPARGAYSVCMHRSDAETVSFAHMHVTNTNAELRYYPAAPCLAKKPESSSLRITLAAPTYCINFQRAS